MYDNDELLLIVFDDDLFPVDEEQTGESEK